LNDCSKLKEYEIFIGSGVIPLGIASFEETIGFFLLLMWGFFYLILKIVFDL
jgi:hypothetical protein